MKHLIIASFVFASLWRFHGDRLWSGWFVVFTLLSAWISYIYAKKTHWSVGLLSFSTFVSSLWVFAWKLSYKEYAGPTAAALSNTAVEACFSFLLITSILAHLTDRSIEAIEDAMALVCLIASCAFVFFDQSLLGNHSINGVFISLLYPFLSMRPERLNWLKLKGLSLWFDLFCVILPIIALFCIGASVPLISMALSMAAYYGAFNNGLVLSKKSKSIFCAAFLLIFVGTCFWLIPNFNNDTGRFKIWRMALDWFDLHANPLYGTGNGTYFMFGPHAQVEFNVSLNNWFIWLHNDWLQIFFEQGIVGFSLLILVGFFTFKQSINQESHYLTSALIALLISGCFNFPLHLGTTAFTSAFIVYRVFNYGGTDGIDKKYF